MSRSIRTAKQAPHGARMASELARTWRVATQTVLTAIDDGRLRAVRVPREVLLENRHHSHVVRPRGCVFVLNPPADFPRKDEEPPASSVLAKRLAKRWGVSVGSIYDAVADERLSGVKISTSHGPPALYIVDPPAAYPKRKHAAVPAGSMTIAQLCKRWRVSRDAIDRALRDGRLAGVRAEGRGRPTYVLNPPATFPRANVGSSQNAVPVPEQAKLWGICDQAIYDAFADGRLVKTKVASPRRTGRQLVTAVANPPAAFPHKPNAGRFASKRNGHAPDNGSSTTLPTSTEAPIKKRSRGRPAGTKRRTTEQIDADAKLRADYLAAGSPGHQEFARRRGIDVDDLKAAFARARMDAREK